MSNNLRRDVLKCFKSLVRASEKVFNGDEYALTLSRNKINEEYRKNKNVTDPVVVAELIKYSKEIENELVTTVIQAKEVEPGMFQLKINPETVKLHNVPFKDCGS